MWFLIGSGKVRSLPGILKGLLLMSVWRKLLCYELTAISASAVCFELLCRRRIGVNSCREFSFCSQGKADKGERSATAARGRTRWTANIICNRLRLCRDDRHPMLYARNSMYEVWQLYDNTRHTFPYFKECLHTQRLRAR